MISKKKGAIEDEVLPFIRILFPDADAHDIAPLPKSMVARPAPVKSVCTGIVMIMRLIQVSLLSLG